MHKRIFQNLLEASRKMGDGRDWMANEIVLPALEDVALRQNDVRALLRVKWLQLAADTSN